MQNPFAMHCFKSNFVLTVAAVAGLAMMMTPSPLRSADPSTELGRQEMGRPNDGEKHGGGKRPPHGGPLMHALDSDRDGGLSAAEIRNAAEALLALDADGDGALSQDELRPPRPQGRPAPGGR